MPDLQMATLADSATLMKILWFITVLALLVERALSLVFEHPIWTKMENTFETKGFKEVVAFALCWIISNKAGFDAFGIMFTLPPGRFGMILTACMIAGGSKGMVKLMRDVLGVGKVPMPVKSTRRSGS